MLNHDRLIHLIKKNNLDMKEFCIIGKLYYNQIAVVKEEIELSEQIEVRRGVRQGMCLLPCVI